MKFRLALFTALIALLLTACNMTLAQDVTPPPGAVQPAQPQPTSGPVFPAQAPDPQNGATLYAQECAPCHGETGLGDGSMSAQLTSQNITVPALGAPGTANAASPAGWFTIVTVGNMQRFMPPFANKLSDQERWDVVAHALSLSTTPEQIAQGEELFEENCAGCPTDLFTNQEKMATLSRDALVNLLAEGGEGLPALGDKLSQDELQSVAAYLRTLTLGAPSLAAEPAPATPTAAPAQTEAPLTETAGEGTPPAEGTPGTTAQVGVTPEAIQAPKGIGPVSGKVIHGSTGEALAGLTVTLHGFEHSTTDPNTAPLEVYSESVDTDSTGAYVFENVELPEGRIFLAEASYQGIPFASELAVSEADATEMVVPDITVYNSTKDSGGLVVEQVHLSFDMSTEGSLQVFELFSISNTTNEAYVFTTDGTTLPFLPLPEGATDVGLQLSQDSAPIVATENNDEYAMLPSETNYSLITFYNMPYDKSLEIKHPLALPVNSVLVIVPEGIKVKSDILTDAGVQQTEQGFNIQKYSAQGLSAGSSVELTLSGNIKPAATVDNKQTFLIGAGAFGVVLILAGVWMFLRDRNKEEEEDFEDGEADEDEFETSEEVMDAIIALDDLYRAKKIPDEAYQKRRAELKERLKELS